VLLERTRCTQPYSGPRTTASRVGAGQAEGRAQALRELLSRARPPPPPSSVGSKHRVPPASCGCRSRSCSPPIHASLVPERFGDLTGLGRVLDSLGYPRRAAWSPGRIRPARPRRAPVLCRSRRWGDDPDVSSKSVSMKLAWRGRADGPAIAASLRRYTRRRSRFDARNRSRAADISEAKQRSAPQPSGVGGPERNGLRLF
jgi:hypothetical protein